MSRALALFATTVLLVGCGAGQGPGADDESSHPTTTSASVAPERADRDESIAELLSLADPAPQCRPGAIAGPPDDPMILFLRALGLDPIVDPCRG